jgi:hypothetical protein
MAARSKAWDWGLSIAGIAVSNSGGGMDVSLLIMFSGRVLCDRPITPPEESY